MSEQNGTKGQLQFTRLGFNGRSVLRPHEIAAKLCCDVRHVYDLIEAGQLRALNIAARRGRRCLRIPVEAWEAFLLRNTL